MSEKPGCEGVCGVDGVKMIENAADHRRSKARPNQLRKQNIGQTSETVSGKQLASDFDSCLAELLDPSR